MDIGQCVNQALEVYKRNLGQLVLAAIVTEVLILVSLTILAGPLIGGWSVLTVAALRREDRRVDFGDLFRGFDRFFSCMGLFYFTFLAVAVGLVFLIVPGMWLMTVWFFTFFLLMDRGQGVFESLGTSTQIVQRSGFWNYFVLLILVLAISFAPSLIPVAGVVIGWFLMPLAWLIEAAAYVQETGGKKLLPSAAAGGEFSDLDFHGQA